MKRREFIAQCFVAPLLINYSSNLAAASRNDSSSVAYLAAAQSRLGEHSLKCFNHQNEMLTQHDIPSRGHGFALSSQGHIAAFARRPSDFCLILDQQGNKVVEFNAPDDRHFYGHGVFDINGDYLYLTENDFEHARGIIGIYDVRQDFQRIGEFESHGVGPHMIQLDNAGRQLIVANGGIETHPNTGRKKLNVLTMQPSIAFIDLQSGELIRKAELDSQYHKNSIRHFSVASDNTIYLGLQNQGRADSAALLAKLPSSASQIEKLTLPEHITKQLSNYVGDICLDQSERYLMASSPYGNSLVFIDLNTSESSTYKVDDVCAVSCADQINQFIVSSGTGMIFSVDLKDGINAPIVQTLANYSSGLAWDNHLFSISANS